MNISKVISSAILICAFALAGPSHAQKKGWKIIPPEFKAGKENVQRSNPNKQNSNSSNAGYSRGQRKTDSKQTYFNIPQQYFYAQGEGGSVYVTVDAHNTNWHIEQLPKDWVTVSDLSSSGFRLNFSENPDANDRKTYMSLVADDGNDRIIQIFQNGSVQFKVTGIDFANTNVTGEKFFSGFGEPLYSRELNYLLPRVTYNGPGKKRAKRASVRIIFPDRSVDDAEKEGDFTYEYVINCEPGEGNTALLYPWGGDQRRDGVPYYFPGEYALELWVDGELAYTKPFTVSLRPEDYGAEIIDYWVDPNIEHDGELGMMVHSRINSQNLAGYKVLHCIFIHDDEGYSLRDNLDRPIQFYESQDVESNDFSWNDWSIFVPYSTIRSALNGAREFTFNIEVRNAQTDKPLSRVKDLNHTL